MGRGLSIVQKQVLEFVEHNGGSATYRELQDRFGAHDCHNKVYRHDYLRHTITRLEKRGLLKKLYPPLTYLYQRRLAETPSLAFRLEPTPERIEGVHQRVPTGVILTVRSPVG